MNDLDKQELRHQVLALLAASHPAARNAEQLKNRVHKQVDFDFTAQDLQSALLFLEGLRHVRRINDDLGSGIHWAATSEGVLMHERGQRNPPPARHD